MVATGTLVELDARQHPRSFLHRSDPTDVARTEHLTFISTPREVDAGPTNNWMSREDAERRVWPLFDGAMKGRTLFVVPYVMGPPGSRFSRIGVEITDSPYVVLSLRLMTRIGRVALERLGTSERFMKSSRTGAGRRGSRERRRDRRLIRTLDLRRRSASARAPADLSTWQLAYRSRPSSSVAAVRSSLPSSTKHARGNTVCTWVPRW
jgi:hypothetical protein